jgi:hypothetical protein
MKIYEQSYKRAIYSYILLVCILLGVYFPLALADEPSGETVKIVSEEEMPAVLGLIGESIRDNYERIQTWSGEIDVKINWIWTGAKAEEYFEKLTDRTGEKPQELLQKVEEKVAFAVDAKKGFVYIDNNREKPCKFQNLTSKKELGYSSGSYLTGPFRSTLIASPDYIIEAEPGGWDKTSNLLTHMKAVKKPSQKQPGTGLYNGMEDPRKVFMPQGNPWEHFNGLAKQINKLNKIDIDGHKFKIEEHKKGQITEYKIIYPASMVKEVNSPEDYVIFTTTYSSQCAFNITYWEVKSGSGKLGQLYTWEYELVDNVYLPKRVIKKTYDSNGRTITETDCTYTHNKVNQEISPGTFEPTNLNLKDGDVLVDEISKEEYRYEAATKAFKLSEKQK